MNRSGGSESVQWKDDLRQSKPAQCWRNPKCRYSRSWGTNYGPVRYGVWKRGSSRPAYGVQAAGHLPTRSHQDLKRRPAAPSFPLLASKRGSLKACGPEPLRAASQQSLAAVLRPEMNARLLFHLHASCGTSNDILPTPTWN